MQIKGTLLKLNPRFSKRVRKLFRSHRSILSGITEFEDTVAVVVWTPGRQRFTDRLVNRLMKISAVKVIA